jgi:hypothetical protein
MLSALRKYWNRCVVFGTALMTLFSGFVAVPPVGTGDTLFKFGNFLVAILSGIWLFPLSRFARREYSWRWWLISVVFAVASTAAFVHYTNLLEKWSVPYFHEKRWVIGETKTEDAKKFCADQTKKGQQLSDLELLRWYGGNSSAVWEQKELDDRQHSLAGWYLAALLMLSSAVITVSQAMYCATSPGLSTRRVLH